MCNLLKLKAIKIPQAIQCLNILPYTSIKCTANAMAILSVLIIQIEKAPHICVYLKISSKHLSSTAKRVYVLICAYICENANQTT